MTVYGVFQCFRHEGERFLNLYHKESDAQARVEEILSEWDGHTRWGRVTNLSHDFGPCLRAVRVRETAWTPRAYPGDNFVSRAYPLMFVIVPLEVK